MEVYRAFFDRCAGWLRDGGRLGLQLICLDNVGHEGSRAGRGAASELIRVDIFPESMPASLSELVLGWETHFELERFLDHHDHYRRTFRAWGLAYRDRRARAPARWSATGPRATFARYFAAGESLFRLREDSLYRVVLKKRPRPKVWAASLRPSDLRARPSDAAAGRLRSGASPAAVRSHYDVSNDFYALWLGPDDDVLVGAVVVGSRRPRGPRCGRAAEDRLLRRLTWCRPRRRVSSTWAAAGAATCAGSSSTMRSARPSG